MTPLLPDDTTARCLGCGYSLRGLTEPRCPECGRPFDPADPTTFWRDRVPGRVGRFFLKAPGWPLDGVAVLGGLTMLVSDSAPGGYFALFTLAVRLWLVIGAAWLVRLGVNSALTRYYRQAFREQLARWRRWCLAPAVAAVTAGLVVARVPLHVTFWLSRSAMDRLAQQVMNAPPDAPAPPDQWVGLYHAKWIERCGDEMRFEIPGTVPFGQGGFVYSPSGRSYWCERRPWPFDGPWYIWMAHFEE